MTFVGKVLVILNLVFGICMMVFAGAVYTVQTSWKAKHDTVAKQLADANTKNSQQVSTLEAEKNALTLQMNEATQRATQAEGTIGQKDVEIAGLEAAKLAAEQEKEQYQARAQIATDQSKILKDENKVLMQLNTKLLKTNDGLVTAINQKDEQIYKQNRTIESVGEKYNSLLVQNQDFERLFRAKGIDPLEVVADDTPLPPPAKIQGLVLNTRKETAKGVEYIEISIGSDDGLAEGHELFVTRKDGRGKYLGKIRLIYVTPDRAVGTVVEQAKNGVIERGDDVSTEI